MLLYIHIPFCDSKCFYCAFNSYTSLHILKDQYIQALKKQLEFELKNHNKKIKTVFIGGGTPSTIEAKKYEEILQIIKPYLENNTCEITIEANPNSAKNTWLEKIYNMGINRVSFGVQSFDDKKLDFLGRNHNKTQAIEAINKAYKIGFKNINCDIIYDTKLDTKELIDNDLNIISSLPINHVSAYSLTIEEGTKFFHKSNVKVEDEDMANYIFKRLNNMGFYQYEISNFAKNENARSKHNLGYWEYKEYLGIGSGAVGCVNNQRTYTPNDIQNYIQTPLKYTQIEKLTPKDILIEKTLLGFRSIVGVDISQFDNKTLDKIEQLIKADKLYKKKTKVYSKEFIIADELVLFLDL